MLNASKPPIYIYIFPLFKYLANKKDTPLSLKEDLNETTQDILHMLQDYKSILST